MARMLCSKPCWAKAVSLSKVIDLRSAGFMRAKIASMTEMVSAAVFPASRAARVTLALMENEHGPRALADDEVALPMAGFGPSIVAGLEPSGDLFGGPSFRKTIADESPQRRTFLEYGFTPPAQLIGSGGVKRRITPAGQGVASQFPRYGGFRSLKRPGDGADRAAG